jgi:hypothetical protein
MLNLWGRLRQPRVAVSSFLGLIALLALAFVVGFAKVDNSPAAAQYQYRVAVCHEGRTLFISIAALPAHLAHGDTAGPCP